MSEHELWNELGNLYFLSGHYNQAIHAYNKAISSESSYGRPYSNLALISAKHANYEEAIHFYKKSLDLLTDDAEKAVAWNRLGNVYWHLKNYQEAVHAYQSADSLRGELEENQEEPGQLIDDQSEYRSDDKVEEQDPQNPASDFMDFTVPEFEMGFPDFVSVEKELPLSGIGDNQYPRITATTENSPEGTAIPAKSAESLSTGITTVISKENIVEELPQPESDDEGIENLEGYFVPDESVIETIEPESDNTVASNESLVENGEEAVIELPSAIPDTQFHPEDVSFEINSKYKDPAIQMAIDVEDQSGEFVPTEPDTFTRLNNSATKTDSEIAEPIAQTEEALESQSEGVTPETSEAGNLSEDETPEVVTYLTEPLSEVKENTNISEQNYPNLDSNDNPAEKGCQQVEENVQKAEKEIDEEEQKLAKQIEINPRSATTWEALGTLYKTAGRYDEAVQAFRQAISILPGNVSYYHNLGLVYYSQGKNGEAFNTFQKVLELDPNHSLTHASLGGYYKKMGLDELAQKHIGKAMKSIYESENEYNRACLDAICGNRDQAVELLRIALENKQTYVDWVLNDPDLDSLRDDYRFKQLISEFSR